MRIHALSMATVRVKHAVLYARTGPLRQVRLLTRAQHPLVQLPSHDPEAATRLEARMTI